MTHARATYRRNGSRRGGPEFGSVDPRNTLGQHGYSGGDTTHSQPGFIPYGLPLGPVLGGPYPSSHWSVDGNMVDDESYIAGLTSVTVSETTCDVPYTTMVSSTKNIECSRKRHALTHVGKESAHVCLAVLLLRESFDSVPRCRVPGMRLCTLLEVHPHESAT
jgi:hypothetical protein